MPRFYSDDLAEVRRRRVYTHTRNNIEDRTLHIHLENLSLQENTCMEDMRRQRDRFIRQYSHNFLECDVRRQIENSDSYQRARAYRLLLNRVFGNGDCGRNTKGSDENKSWPGNKVSSRIIPLPIGRDNAGGQDKGPFPTADHCPTQDRPILVKEAVSRAQSRGKVAEDRTINTNCHCLTTSKEGDSENRTDCDKVSVPIQCHKIFRTPFAANGHPAAVETYSSWPPVGHKKSAKIGIGTTKQTVSSRWKRSATKLGCVTGFRGVRGIIQKRYVGESASLQKPGLPLPQKTYLLPRQRFSKNKMTTVWEDCKEETQRQGTMASYRGHSRPGMQGGCASYGILDN